MKRFYLLLAITSMAGTALGQSLGANFTGLTGTAQGGDIYRVSGTYSDPIGVTTGIDLQIGDYLWTLALNPGDTCRAMQITNIVSAFAGFVEIDVDAASQGAPSTQNSKLIRHTPNKGFAYVPAGGSEALRECISQSFANVIDSSPDRLWDHETTQSIDLDTNWISPDGTARGFQFPASGGYIYESLVNGTYREQTLLSGTALTKGIIDDSFLSTQISFIKDASNPRLDLSFNGISHWRIFKDYVGIIPVAADPVGATFGDSYFYLYPLRTGAAGSGQLKYRDGTTGAEKTVAAVEDIDGSETVVQGGSNVTVTGNGTSASPYVVNSTASGGGGSGGSAAIAQVHVDSTGANGYDGLPDDTAFQAAWDTLVANKFKSIALGHGATYDLTHIDWSLYNTADTSSMVTIYGNSAVILLDSQTVHPGNIEMNGVANIVWKDVTFKSKRQLTDNPYNINNSFLYLNNTANVTLDNIATVRPYSHGIRAENHRPTTGTEKQGINFVKFIGREHLDNITEYSSGYSYIYLGPGAEYNQYGMLDFYSGQGGVRGHGSANETYSNVVAEEMEVPSAYFDSDSLYQTGIIYYENSNPSTNSGKITIGEFTGNHNNRIVPIVVKQEAGNYPPRPLSISNSKFLVNGADTEVGEMIYLKNCDNCSVNGVDFRPRQKPGSATIILDNCKEFLFSNSSIFQTSGGIDGFELLNGSTVILSNPKLDVNNVVKAGSDGTVFYSTAKDAPTYANIFAANTDEYLAQNSFYRVAGQTSMQQKDTTASTSSFSQPNLVIDDSTSVRAFPQTSAEKAVSIDQNDVPATWTAGDEFECFMYVTIDSLLLNNQ